MSVKFFTSGIPEKRISICVKSLSNYKNESDVMKKITQKAKQYAGFARAQLS